MSVYVPVGLTGLFNGLILPDLDIVMLGLGAHRYFMYHSAIGLAVLKRLYRIWSEKQKGGGSLQRAFRKVCGVALAGCAVGVGIHLVSDALHPKTVIFPFFGSLISGTMVDDTLWLLGNAVWAFKIAADTFVLVLAEDEISAREWLKCHNPFGNQFGTTA